MDIGKENIYLAEGVFSVIEVKSNLTRDKLTESAKSLSKVAKLKINTGASISSGPKLDRPLRVVFSYVGASWKTIIDEIDKKNFSEIFDLICILDRGTLVKKGGIINWPSQQNFKAVNSKSAALGFLYLYLLSYGTSFSGRGLILNPYFEPLSKWSDN